MATARIVHYWPDDSGSTILEVEVDGEYPDSLDEARLAVQAMWRECIEAAEAGE